MAKTKFCQGISDISDSYSAFILDQWGVLHNGEHAYEGVIDCLKELKGRKKHIIILSNSGKRAEQNRDRLKELGIGPSLCRASRIRPMVCSGILALKSS